MDPKNNIASSVSPASPPTNLHHTPSSREKEVIRAAPLPGPIFLEKDFISPASPITNYEERPYEAPQAISVDPKYLLYERDIAEEAPEVVDPSPPYARLNDDPTEDHGASATAVGLTSQARNLVDDSAAERGGDGTGSQDALGSKKDRTCGMSRRTFWIIFVVILVVVIAGAVGGGVGGGLTKKHNDENSTTIATSNSAAEIQSSTVPITTTQPTTTTAASASATKTASAEGPVITGWSLTVFSHKNFTGSSSNFTVPGLFQATFPDADPQMLSNPFGDPNNATTARYNSSISNSYIWLPTDSGCCVRFCRNNTNLGYRCTSVTRQPDASLDKVVLGCGATPAPETCAGQGDVEKRGLFWLLFS